MTPTETAILSAVVSSSILVVGLEFIGDKIFARFRYRGWQAVFLVSGQVYFGKITSATRNDIRLTDIYYLQSVDPKVGSIPDINSEEVSLVKLGEELHGPEDLMIMGRAHILFTETLKETAQVVKAIAEYKKQQV
jgi:hypothetical protein